MASLPQNPGQRLSIVNRISSIFDRRRVPVQDNESLRATTTFEVPLFLSPTRYEQHETQYESHFSDDSRSRSSTQSLIETAVPTSRVRPLTLTTSSLYSSQPNSPTLPQPALPIHRAIHDDSLSSSNTYPADDALSRTRPRKGTHRQQRKRRKPSRKAKILSLRRLSVVFGITLLVTLITYLVLAVTGTAAGIMFHVLMILLILSLTGVFVHSALRLFLLIRHNTSQQRVDREVSVRHRRQRHNRPFFGEVQSSAIEHTDEVTPEKPIRVIMAEDEESVAINDFETQEVKRPPPVYGNFRSSKRINPSLIHWQKVPPSPLTPTYDEAVSTLQRAVGYRPPSYTESERGISDVVNQNQFETGHALKDMHPLERERVVNLGRNVF